MPATKNPKTGTWTVQFRYKNWEQQTKSVCKRGFQTKREANEWEQSFLRELKQAPDITFGEFWNIYIKDRSPRMKFSTMDTKQNIVEKKILPYFENRCLRSITSTDVMTWQNILLKSTSPRTGKPYSTEYLKTVHNQLSAILNHAMRYYGLKVNPAVVVGNMGRHKKTEMLIWTEEEYMRFSEVMMKEPTLYYAFEVLYWMGIRRGELLALTREDVDLERHTMRINKTLYTKGQASIATSPKTDESNRTIVIPDFLVEELEEFFSMNYDLKPKDRLFPVTASTLCKHIASGAAEAGIKRIRVHDLRHSHVSLLINRGFSAVQIARRVGHSSQDITYRYAHLFPNDQANMAEALDKTRRLCGNG